MIDALERRDLKGITIEAWFECLWNGQLHSWNRAQYLVDGLFLLCLHESLARSTTVLFN